MAVDGKGSRWVELARRPTRQPTAVDLITQHYCVIIVAHLAFGLRGSLRISFFFCGVGALLPPLGAHIIFTVLSFRQLFLVLVAFLIS